MANRTTKVTLMAEVSQYLEGMERAARATRETGTEAEKLAQKRQAMEGLGRGALVFGALAAAGVALAVAKFAEFDQAMSNVNAVTQETAANQALLRDAALEAGGRTVYTATEAANAIEELGKAGLATADILGGGLDGALDLAASGQLEVARAAEITATTLKQYNLAGDQAGRVADVLSAGAGKALGSVEDLAQGLKFVGPVAQAMGISLEETTATLALFADQGIVGEQAGTSLRGMLSSLTSPSKQARAEIDELGITLYDASGTFLGLENAAGELNKAYGEMDGASRDASLGILFGNQQLTAANVLASKGADAVAEYTEAVNESGYAARVAADRLDNLAGDVEKLGGAFDTALIKSGSGANDTLRTMVQTATFLVDGFGDLPQPVLDASLAIGAVAAAVALTTGVIGTGLPKFMEFRTHLSTLGISGGKAALGIGLVGGAVGVAVIAISAFAQSQAEAKARTDALADSLDQSTGAFTEYTRDLVKDSLAARDTFMGIDSGLDSAYEAAEKLGLSLETVTDATMGNAEAYEVVKDALNQYNLVGEDRDAILKKLGLSENEYYAAQGQLRDGIVRTMTELGGSIEVTKQKIAADKTAAAAAKEQADALAVLEGRAVDTNDAIDGLADTIRGFGAATLDVRSAEREFQSAIDDATASLVENGATLDVNTDIGRENEAALDAIAEAAKDVAAATYDRTGSEEEAAAAVQRGRDALIEQLAQFGITGDAANAYADELGLIPGNVYTAVELDTSTALGRLRGFVAELKATGEYGTGVSLMWSPPSGTAIFGNEVGGMWAQGVKEFATGGFESGIYAGGQNIHKFAETGLPWETYISPKPGYERQNIGYAIESLGRLGVDLSQLGQQSSPSGPMQISGTLDLGNGLTGVIRGVAESLMDSRAADTNRGWRL